MQSADHWLIPLSLALCCDFIISNKSSVCVRVFQNCLHVAFNYIQMAWMGKDCGSCARFINAV